MVVNSDDVRENVALHLHDHSSVKDIVLARTTDEYHNPRNVISARLTSWTKCRTERAIVTLAHSFQPELL